MPGFKLKVKGDYARIESLLCPYCKKILKEAIQTEQGFRLCLSCYDEIQKDPNILQGIEEVELEPNEPYHPDKAVRREVSRIPVYCENEEQGCGWSGSLGDHEKDHKQVCQYKSEDCPNGCGERLLVDRLDSHLKSQCLLRAVQCQYCQTTVMAKDYDSHLSNCPSAPFKCESCGEEVSQTEKNNHCYLTCKRALKCAGCKQQVALSEIGDHLCDSSQTFLHMQHLKLKMKLSKSKIRKSLNEVLQKIDNERGGSEEVQVIRKELQAIKEEFDEKFSTKTDKLIRDLSRKVNDLEGKLTSFQSRPLAQGFQSGASLDEYSSDRMGQLEGKIAETDRQLAVLKVNISELELQLQASLASTYNGSFLWRIPDIKRRRRDALEGKITSIYSPPFYTGRNGYKMCVRAYLNGDGIGYNTHLSIFFVLMKGEYDPLLKWPFDYKVSLILVDQDHRRHIVQTFKPSPSSSSFQKPKSDMNIASGCPKFAELKVLDNESYIKEDVMYIKCIVDTQRIYHP